MMATKAKTDYRPREKELPSILTDPKTNKRYARGRFLGKGGFAKCYELTDTETNEVYAGKIVSKGLLLKQHQKEKMSQEITIHKTLNHKHVVGFVGFFEDSDNVYIILELCRRRSLMELHKRRKTVSEPEARYFLRHIVLACKYLHDTKVIHRDLKLGNLFLNETMEVKIGDFGLATKLDYDGERKKTLCGTPNYIAPEVLGKRGHSYEVDAWSLGCILFTLLVGKPPFETSSLKDTYSRIKKNEYVIPLNVSAAPRNLIRRLLNADPAKRPSMDAILHDDFLTKGFLPTRLPTSCCSMAPRFDNKVDPSFVRKPLLELNAKPVVKSSVSVPVKKVTANQPLDAVPEGAVLKARNEKEEEELPEDLRINNEDSGEQHLTELLKQLNAVFDKKVTERPLYQEDEAEDPAANPVFWISKWVDYSDKYGLGYQLCDNSVGVVFNDSTKIVLLADGDNIHYIDRSGRENYHRLNNHPDSLNKKMTLLKYFRNYMNEHLLKAGAALTPRDGDELSRIPNLRTWLRTRNAIILQLTNGTMQINFFSDHTKLILCPLMGAVTFFDDRQNIRTFRLSLIAKYGCSSELSTRLRFARSVIRDRLLIAEADKRKAET